MITVIKNINVYAPEKLGKKDVVIVNDKIEGIYDNLNIPDNFVNISVIDGKGKILFPGFLDCHVHIIGGGGEGGFKTRTPEISIVSLIEAGITTVVGCIGTDGICRNMRSLIAKANGLEEEGITSYCYTGSYEIPVKTITDSIKGDLMMVDKIIGVGEVALSDHRSSQATYQDFVNTVAQARVGGILSGKAGIVNVHLGDGARRLEYLFKVIEETEIPPTQLLPTHINRSDKLFKVGIEYAKKGGFIDLTTSSDPRFLEPGELRACEGLTLLLKNGVDIKHITFSSDGNGSMPVFDNDGKLVGLGICSVETLYREVKDSIKEYNVPIEDAIKVITSNVAEVLKLNNKGKIEKERDADLVIVNEDTLDIDMVIAKGKIVVKDGNTTIKPTFN
ncbi:beta-aspartyl-peptidase [Clostridium celatum]|uniref:Isoaspartyl dipeptidase n=1 Tax=Clostridium celatum DSM 1785 TaxID=545697 RepID=L1QLE6_9CLOT|nr:beta-aspartyl-peptidase [Clostridium celatum]EKY28550.1 beta-aspartyl peptidase [Clostridium celatum DSM 1785]MCE9656885.1 beta-aspartyl-peptidase [Clostridium celatum]MDU2265300.1 beta-aspartyl-peptidase [Clostridium celatum]MDU3722822.1 beta-aspartyl-peptidase [Clostridium celatum]MDU6294932.1 beta-aspartyl-peptidase [Clostridium celatum]